MRERISRAEGAALGVKGGGPAAVGTLSVKGGPAPAGIGGHADVGDLRAR